MSCSRFEQLMLGTVKVGESFSRRFNRPLWLDSLRNLTMSVFSSLQDYKGSVHRDYPHEAAALAAICCELHFERHYQVAIERGWLRASAPSSCHEVELEMSLPRVLEQLDLCERDAQVTFVQNAIAETGATVTEAEAESLICCSPQPFPLYLISTHRLQKCGKQPIQCCNYDIYLLHHQ